MVGRICMVSWASWAVSPSNMCFENKIGLYDQKYTTDAQKRKKNMFFKVTTSFQKIANKIIPETIVDVISNARSLDNGI